MVLTNISTVFTIPLGDSVNGVPHSQWHWQHPGWHNGFDCPVTMASTVPPVAMALRVPPWQRRQGRTWNKEGKKLPMAVVVTALLLQPRFAILFLLTTKMGVNYLLLRVNLVITIYLCKKSVYQQRFFMVKLNFQWHLDSKVTCSSNFDNYQKNYRCKKFLFTMFNLVNYR